MKLQDAPQVEQFLLDASVNLVAAILILCAGWVVSRWAARWTRRGLSRVAHFDQTLTPLTAHLVRYLIIAAAAIAVLERFGVATTSLVAVLGAAGLAVGLALQGTLSNVAAGVMLLMLRPFRAGDAVTAGGRSGTVREIGLFTTILIGDDLSWASVPNASIFSGVIVNNSREPVRRVSFTMSIDVANDADAAEAIILDVLHGEKRVLPTPEPDTGVQSIHENAIDISVRFAAANTESEQALFAVQRAIRKRFHEAGIAMPIQGTAAAAGSAVVSTASATH